MCFKRSLFNNASLHAFRCSWMFYRVERGASAVEDIGMDAKIRNVVAAP